MRFFRASSVSNSGHSYNTQLLSCSDHLYVAATENLKNLGLLYNSPNDWVAFVEDFRNPGLKSLTTLMAGPGDLE